MSILLKTVVVSKQVNASCLVLPFDHLGFAEYLFNGVTASPLSQSIKNKF